jgi:tetratricopeptide (TPR) repeat protein
MDGAALTLARRRQAVIAMGKKSRAKQQNVAPAVVEEAPVTPAQQDKRRFIALAVAIVVVTLAIYAQVRTHDFINYDDRDYVLNNRHVTTGLTVANAAWAFTAFHASNWHPLTWLSHQLDVSLFGLVAGRHLLVNVLLHALNSILLLLFLSRATGRTWPSAFVAALFALHPTHVESVAWVSERKDVLSTFFFMTTLLAYLSWTRKRTPLRYGLVVLSFALGLMAKPMLVTLPFVLLLLDAWPLRRVSGDSLSAVARGIVPYIVEKVPLFLLLIPTVLLTLKAQTKAITPIAATFRYANAVDSYVAYIGKMLWPSNLAIFYPYRIAISPTFTAFALIVLIVVTAFAYRQFAKRPYVLAGWLWFLGTLVPVIGIVQVGQQSIADRYTYVPFIGLFVAIVWFVADELELRPSYRPIAGAIAAAVLLAFSAVSFVYISKWRDSETLFTHVLRVTERNDVAHIDLAVAQIDQLRYEEAAANLRAALAIHDTDIAHENLGIALGGLGKREEALREHRAAIALNPKNVGAYQSIGRLQLDANHKKQALTYLRQALQLADDPETRAMIAIAEGDLDTAITQYRAAVARKPGSAALHNDLAAALARKGLNDEAIAEYNASLRIAPHEYDAHMNLGALLSRMDRNAEAAELFGRAAADQPTATEPHVYRALTYANMGRIREAADEIAAAIALDEKIANEQLTNAIRIPFKETNIRDYLGFLQTQAAARK